MPEVERNPFSEAIVFLWSSVLWLSAFSFLSRFVRNAIHEIDKCHWSHSEWLYYHHQQRLKETA